MLENTVVDDWDVKDGESEHEASHDSEEEELVSPDVVHPLGESALGIGLHLEEAAAQVHHLPGEEEGEPGHAGEGCGAGAEHGVTSIWLGRVVVLGVAACREVSIAPAEHYEGECRQTQGSHPDTIHEGVDDDLPGENTLLL